MATDPIWARETYAELLRQFARRNMDVNEAVPFLAAMIGDLIAMNLPPVGHAEAIERARTAIARATDRANGLIVERRAAALAQQARLQ